MAELVFVGTEASSQGGQVRGWSVEEAGDSTLFSLDNVHTDVIGSLHSDFIKAILLHRDFI